MKQRHILCLIPQVMYVTAVDTVELRKAGRITQKEAKNRMRWETAKKENLIKQKKIGRLEKTNYFICLTPLHFYFSYSIAWKLYEENRSHSVILVKGNFNYKNQKPEAFLELVNIKNDSFMEKVICKIKYTYLFRSTSLHRSMRKDMGELYVFNFNDPLTKNMLRYAPDIAKVTYVEEGLGSWNHSWDGGTAPKRVDCALMGEPEMFRNTHPDYSGEIMKLDYQEFFNRERSAGFCSLTAGNTQIGQMDYLYLGLCENETVETKYEMEILEKIIQFIPKDKTFYIKKHPRDMGRKYYDLAEQNSNVKIMDRVLNQVPVECLIWTNNISTILSIMSSAGVYIPYLKKGIKSVFLYKMDAMKKTGLYSSGTFQEGEMESFNRFLEKKDDIYCPENDEQLRRVLF